MKLWFPSNPSVKLKLHSFTSIFIRIQVLNENILLLVIAAFWQFSYRHFEVEQILVFTCFRCFAYLTPVGIVSSKEML
jgi:hypothetical protein